MLLLPARTSHVGSFSKESEVIHKSQPTGTAVAYPGIFFGGGSTNSVQDTRKREWGPGGGSPLVRGSIQFANE
jgi:hypothetical protein